MTDTHIADNADDIRCRSIVVIDRFLYNIFNCLFICVLQRIIKNNRINLHSIGIKINVNGNRNSQKYEMKMVN